ncbi:protamine-like [Pieris rapae]|uniref:protamine-like n=1 Tax=Pieris rapae TaxID=64459 RepID=UPI000B927D4A|nr:protamine-like [Pieris rapae]
MSGLSCDGMEPEAVNNNEKKINDDVKSFLLKRSEHELPRYTARIRTYLDVKRKRQRANEARRNTESKITKKKTETETKEDTAFLSNDDDRVSRSRRDKVERARPVSHGQEPTDRCCRRRRRRRSCRRRRRRRRRRSCRRRRRRSCSRRRRRRRRRSCSRRRRRRSCRRRRRRNRRCGCRR